MKRLLYVGMVVVLLTVPACAGRRDTIAVNEEGWQIQDLGLPVAQIFEIVAVGDQRMPTYNDCADADGRPRAASQCALDLIFVASPDYRGAMEQRYAGHVQEIILNVFGVPNSLNRNGNFGQPLRPFRFYATEYRYPDTTLAGTTGCSPGLPSAWVPGSDTVDPEAPSWDCNLALSTAGVELNVGFVMHTAPLYDRSRYNLFTAEYNSYAAILHELAHATFVLPDEGPFAPSETGLRWILKEFANIFLVSNAAQRAACEQTCAETYRGHCVDIFFLDAAGELTNHPTNFARCEAAEGESASNLMYFYPQPAPGENEHWAEFAFYYGAANRTQYIYDKCRRAAC
jgi:hypothetical protein